MHQTITKPFLPKKAAEVKLNCAKAHRNLTSSEWKEWVFSDECSVQLMNTTIRKIVCKQEERNKTKNLQKRVQKGDGSLMV